MVAVESSGSMSTESKFGGGFLAETTGERDPLVGISDATSRFDGKVELGLSLAALPQPLRGEGIRYCRFLTAKDLRPPRASPSSPASVSSPDSPKIDCHVDSDARSYASKQSVVGWPPIRAFRMNTLINLPKEISSAFDATAQEARGGVDGIQNEVTGGEDCGKKSMPAPACLRFVKVNMDGDPIGRKVDLSSHASYESLALAIEAMFRKPDGALFRPSQCMTASKLLDGASELALTYEDKEGDWMLVGDVPWRMFLNAVTRLRIMRTSDARGLERIST